MDRILSCQGMEIEIRETLLAAGFFSAELNGNDASRFLAVFGGFWWFLVVFGVESTSIH